MTALSLPPLKTYSAPPGQVPRVVQLSTGLWMDGWFSFEWKEVGFSILTGQSSELLPTDIFPLLLLAPLAPAWQLASILGRHVCVGQWVGRGRKGDMTGDNGSTWFHIFPYLFHFIFGPWLLKTSEARIWLFFLVLSSLPHVASYVFSGCLNWWDKKYSRALAGGLIWLERRPITKRWWVQYPVREHT